MEGFSEFFKAQQEAGEISKKKTKNRKLKCKNRDKSDVSKKNFKRHRPAHSFVINSAPTKGLRLIKIQVLDLESTQLVSDSVQDDSVLLSSQYVVKDVGDEIMNQTEKIICDISKKICNYSYTGWY